MKISTVLMFAGGTVFLLVAAFVALLCGRLIFFDLRSWWRGRRR